MNKWQAVFLIVIFAFGVRLATLNQIGRTWDEGAYIEPGFKFVQLFVRGNFTDPFWYIQSDHPPLIRYAYGLAGILDIKKILNDGTPIYEYNYTWPRLVSALLGSLTTIFLVLIGYKYFSSYVGISAGLIFSLIPFFVGLSQLATLESFIMFFFTGSVYFYLKYLENKSIKFIFLTGIFCGLSMLVKQSNILIYPLLILIGLISFYFEKKRNIQRFYKSKIRSLIFIIFTSLGTIFILWPMPFFHLKELWNVQQTMWIDAVHLPPPERFFGRLMLVPFPYYFVMFLITTPFLLVVLSLIGALKIDKKKTFAGLIIVLWFLFPFIQMLYPFQQHGVRYIIQIYAPFALLCAIGLDYINQWFKGIKGVGLITLLFVITYLLLILYKISPYYLDYFNEVVGGNNYIYENQLFQMGWWGQGIGEATNYISSIARKTVTVAVDGPQPAGVVPRLKNIKIVYYDKNKTSDFVISPYFNIVRLGFMEAELNKKYKLVYIVHINKAELVRVFKKI